MSKAPPVAYKVSIENVKQIKIPTCALYENYCKMWAKYLD